MESLCCSEEPPPEQIAEVKLEVPGDESRSQTANAATQNGAGRIDWFFEKFPRL